MRKELIKQFEPQAIFAPGVTESQLAELETLLSLILPKDLKALLQESNGVFGMYGLHLIWSTEEIVHQHRLRRTHPAYKDFQPVDDLLFFADAGNGDCFAFPLLQGKSQETVVVWNHESQSREAVATSLQDYLERWLCGEIRISVRCGRCLWGCDCSVKLRWSQAGEVQDAAETERMQQWGNLVRVKGAKQKFRSVSLLRSLLPYERTAVGTPPTSQRDARRLASLPVAR